MNKGQKRDHNFLKGVNDMKYKRVILKLSGETLQSESKMGCF